MAKPNYSYEKRQKEIAKKKKKEEKMEEKRLKKLAKGADEDEDQGPVSPDGDTTVNSDT